MVNPAYLPHVLYSLAVTSLATHLLWRRTASEEQRRRVGAEIGMLESLTHRLRTGERIADDELERLRNLVRNPVEVGSRQKEGSASSDEISWKEVMLGRAKTASSQAQTDEYERREWEQGEYYHVSDQLS
jgi:hypothetical protein